MFARSTVCHEGADRRADEAARLRQPIAAMKEKRPSNFQDL
jgi:hypothetical protein